MIVSVEGFVFCFCLCFAVLAPIIFSTYGVSIAYRKNGKFISNDPKEPISDEEVSVAKYFFVGLGVGLGMSFICCLVLVWILNTTHAFSA